MSTSLTEERAALLRGVDLFTGLDRVPLARLAAHVEPVTVAAGAVVCAEGDPADALYLVEQGRFAVTVCDDTGLRRRINTLEAGSFFGETALLTADVRTATVTAEMDGELLKLDRATFLGLMEDDPSVARVVATDLARRLRHRDHPDAPEAAHAPVIDAAQRAVAERRAGRVTTIVGILVAAGLAAAAFFAVDLAQSRFVLFLLAAIALWVTEPVPPYVVSLGLVIAWVTTQIVPPYNAILGFASTSWIFVLSVLGIASVMARSGLLLRIGLLLIERVPASLRWQSAAFIVTGITLTPVLPLAMARAAVTAPLSLAVADALRLRDREGASAVLGLSAWVGAGPFIFLFQNGSPVCILAWSLMPVAAQVQMTWSFWLIAALPLAVLIAAGMWVALQLIERPRRVEAPRREPLMLQLAILGPLSRTEKIVGAIVALTLVAWIIGPRLVIDPGLIALVSFLALIIATRGRPSDLGRLDWGYLLFFGVALSLSNITSGLRLDRTLGETMAARLTDFGITGAPYIGLVALATIFVRSFLPADQAILLLSLGFIPVATALNVHPFLAVIAILALGLSWHVPAQTPEYLVARVASEGRLYTDAQARRASYAYMGVALVSLFICMGYWHLIGLL